LALCLGAFLASGFAGATTAEAAWLGKSEAVHVIKHQINHEYSVVRGPYVTHCVRGSARYVRCDTEFKAGLFWRCGRVSVTLRGGYYYIHENQPIC
jgi:hypothetical protein